MPDGAPVAGQLAGLVRALDEAEVEELGLALARDHDVRRLDVAVDEPVLPGVAETVHELKHDLDGGRLLDLAPALDQLLEGLALHVFHRDEVDVAGLAHVVGLDHVGVVEGRGGLGLEEEASDVALVLGEVRVEELEGHDLAELEVARLVDGPHGARAELLEELEARNLALTAGLFASHALEGRADLVLDLAGQPLVHEPELDAEHPRLDLLPLALEAGQLSPHVVRVLALQDSVIDGDSQEDLVRGTRQTKSFTPLAFQAGLPTSLMCKSLAERANPSRAEISSPRRSKRKL